MLLVRVLVLVVRLSGEIALKFSSGSEFCVGCEIFLVMLVDFIRSTFIHTKQMEEEGNVCVGNRRCENFVQGRF